MSREKTRTLAEIPWLSLLPAEQRAGLEPAYDDPEAEEWASLVAADRALEDDFARSTGFSRIVRPLAAVGVIAVLLLALGAPGVAEQRTGGGGSSASAYGTVVAASAGERTVPEENRVVLASLSQAEGEVAGATASGPKTRTPRAPRNGSPAAPSDPPPAATEPVPDPLVSTTLPVVGEVKVPAPKVQLPGIELPQLPQLPPLQLPQLPPLLPPSQQ